MKASFLFSVFRSAAHVRRLFGLLCAGSLSVSLPAATAIWSGGGANGLFTNTANWVGGTLPANGDDILLSATATRRHITNLTSTFNVTFPAVAFLGSNYVIGGLNPNQRVFAYVDTVAMGALGTGVEGTNLFHESVEFGTNSNPGVLTVLATNGTLVISNGLFLRQAGKEIIKSGPGRVIMNNYMAGGLVPARTLINGGTWVEYRNFTNVFGAEVRMTNTAMSSLLQVENLMTVFHGLPTLRLHENAALLTRPIAQEASFRGVALIMRGASWTNAVTNLYVPTNVTFEASAQSSVWRAEGGVSFLGAGTDLVMNVANGAAATDALVDGNLSMSSGLFFKRGAGTLVFPRTLSVGNATVEQGVLHVSNLIASSSVTVASNATASITNLSAQVLHNMGATTLGPSNLATSVILQGGSLNGGLLRFANLVSVGASNVLRTPVFLGNNGRISISNSAAGTVVLGGSLTASNGNIIITNFAPKQTLILAGDVYGDAANLAGTFDVFMNSGECRVTGTNHAGTVVWVTGDDAKLTGTGRLKHAQVFSNATLAPGPGIATLHADGDVRLDHLLLTTVPGRLEVDLLSTNAHDKLVLSSGHFMLDDASGRRATLAINKDPAFSAPAGAVFRIVELPGTQQPAAGHFAGLPEGALVEVGGTAFRISYVGGDGNDITLTVHAPPPSPRWHQWQHGSEGLTMHLTNTPGRLNFLETAGSVGEGTKWSRLATNVTPTSGLTNFLVPRDPRQPIRFFRLGSE